MDLIPWTDKGGRFSPARAATFALLLAPALWIALLAATDGLGPEPLDQALHETGRWALRFLVLSLAVTPLGRLAEDRRIFLLRRMVGLGALAWTGGHVVLYAAQQGWGPVAVLSEIVQRIYLGIGFVALLGLAWLGATSTDAAVRRMGRGWKRLHRIVFPVTALALLHAFIQSKADASPAVFLAGLFLGLLLWRALPKERQGRLGLALAIAVAGAAAAAALEYGWYAAASSLPAGRIAAANLDLAGQWLFGPRPAVLAGLVLAGGALLAGAWRLVPARRRA